MFKMFSLELVRLSQWVEASATNPENLSLIS